MKEKKITLIEGTFKSDEAFELLTKLINYKIQFHQRDDFSKSIRNIQQTHESQERIAALSRDLIELQEFINASKENATNYTIHSEVYIVRKE